MKKYCIIGINIVDGSLEGYQILNTNGPVLYKWYENTTDFWSELSSNQQFISFLKRKTVLTDPVKFHETYIHCVVLKSPIAADEHESRKIYIRDIFDEEILFDSLLDEALKNILLSVSHKVDEELLSKTPKEKYSEIMHKSSYDITDKTFIESIRGYVQQKYSILSLSTIDKFINYVSKIIFN